jgi:Protein of unknwon function (DUF3008)
MKTKDFYTKPNSNALNEALHSKFGEKLDIKNYSIAQLEKAASLIENKISAFKKENFNATLKSEEFHRLKMMQDVIKTALSERAVSKAQQQAAGAALAAKRGKGKAKGASKEMMKMSTKELEKFAGTKHKGLPKRKMDESMQTMAELADHHAMEYARSHKMGKLEHAMHHKSKCEECGGMIYHDDMGECWMKHAGINNGTPKMIIIRPNIPAGTKSPVGSSAVMTSEASKKSKKNDGNLANNYPPYDKVTRGDVIAGRLGKDQMGGKNKKAMRESIDTFLLEGEEAKAELIMAVKDMVDKFTGWSEDIAQMQAQTAMEMADSIRDEIGNEQAQQFAQAVQPSLDSAFQAVKAAREALNNTVGTLTGQGGAPMGAEPAPMPGAEGPATDMGAGLPEPPAEEPAAETPPEGREKRESIERTTRLARILSSRR